MVDVGAFHNGSTNLPLRRTDDGYVVSDASFAERRADQQEIVTDQIRHGVRAEEAGMDQVFFTEHHFQPMGLEFSTNPLMSQMSVAERTERVRLAQIANITVWHDPIRLAEQTALLDVVSDGRAEIGIGRGYQPRENEILGQYWGGTIQDQERNRVSFEEKIDILKKAWTEDLMEYHGEYHQIPPGHTRWHHSQERAYMESDASEYDLDEMINWVEEEDEYTEDSQTVTGGRSTLKTLNVQPKPLQDPHPQLWQPVLSMRTVKWAARHGVNAFITLGPSSRISPIIQAYYDEAEEHGWPDHRPEYDGEPFAYGWDERRRRGIAVYRPIFNTAIADDDALDRFVLGQQFLWQWFGSFFGLDGLLDLSEDEIEALRDRMDIAPGEPLTPDLKLLKEKGVAIVGDGEEIADQLTRLARDCGYEGFNVTGYWETGGMSGEEADAQLEAFAEEVVPYLEDEFPSP